MVKPAGSLKSILEEKSSQGNKDSNTVRLASYRILSHLKEGVVLNIAWFEALGFISWPRPYWTLVPKSDAELENVSKH